MKVSRVKVEDLNPYYKNARRGNVARVRASLQRNGQFKPIVVNTGTHTGRPMEVLAGNHVLKAAKELEWEHLHANVIDVDEAAAARIVLADNKTSDDSTYDERLLDEILSEVLGAEEPDDLEGTGFSMEEVDDLALMLEAEMEREARQPQVDEETGEVTRTAADVLKGNPVVSFTIVFDDADQRGEWDAFVRRLRAEHTDGRSLAAMIVGAVRDL
jgi:ParB-like chromosome segregation protein Spo0J